MYGLSVIDQILCLFCWNYKNFSKLTNTSPKWRHLWNFICVRSMPLKVCITSVCVFISSWCMAWMLSIKYFVLFIQILRFSLNWRTHLQNGVFFGIYITSGQCLLRFVLHPFVFFSVLCVWLECYRSNTLSYLFWNYKIFSKLTKISPKWRLNWYWVRSMPLRFVLHVLCHFWVICVWLECYRLNTLSFLLKF